MEVLLFSLLGGRVKDRQVINEREVSFYKEAKKVRLNKGFISQTLYVW